MPELPEVESARAAIEEAALGRRITGVDDTDSWVCRPHAPGQISAALVGRRLTGAFRRGKSMWCETSGLDGSATPGPVLGVHLGMSGHVLITDADGELTEGGDWLGPRTGRAAARAALNPIWSRFTVTFGDGGSLRLFDQRRLGRVRLDPNLDGLGPDAEQVRRREFGERLGRGHAPIKARLLDQSVIAGVGNLLADETLWQARLAPTRPADELTDAELITLHRAMRRATKAAITKGGVHTGTIIPFRRAGAHCPRCGTEMTRATVGGRTTWWCPQEQT
jgi:formamidopyrimidine-DNA glycosylase